MAFLDTFVETRNGGLAIDCEKALEAVVQGVRKTGKTGTFKLELKVVPTGKGLDVDTIFIKDTIKAEVPEMDKKLSLFYADDKGQLSKRDPRQSDMFHDQEEVTTHGK